MLRQSILICLQILAAIAATRFNVSEEQSSGTFVGQLHNVDPGGTYCFTTICGWSTLFKLDTKIGTITTRQVIDREQLPTSLINLVLEGTDSQGLNTIQWIDVFIEDINDNSPVFLNNVETLSVPEGLGKTSFNLGQWSDADSGNNAMLSAAYLSIGDSSLFSAVIKSSGSYQQIVLHIAKSLDRETKDSYNLTVAIRDKGFPALDGYLTVLLNVQDVNDNQPIFPQSVYRIDVKEDQSVGSQLLTFDATDADIGDNGRVIYYLSGASSLFSVSQDTGVLSVRQALDYETCYSFISSNVKGYRFKVNARDSGLSPMESAATVEVTLVDVNDNNPVISFFSPHMKNNNEIDLIENSPTDTYTATIQVSDGDSGANGECETFIESGGEGKFKINKDSSGTVVLVAENIDREVKDVYDVKITVTDKGIPSRSSSSNLVINILDVNDNAPRFASSSINVPVKEDVLINTLVTTVTAVDPDLGPNGTLRYELSTPHKSFKVSSTGQLTTTQLLDYEKEQHYTLNVTASDSGSPSLSSYQIIKISIVDVNDNMPIFTQSVYTCSVRETAATLNYAVLATDTDSGNNGLVTYSVNSDVISVDQSSGELSLVKPLDYETARSYSVIVKASDHGGRSTNAEVVITVLDVNDETPVFEATSYSASFPEGVLMSKILKVKATDADSDDSVSYQLTQSNAMFTINNDGVLSNTQTASTGTITLSVCAIDSAGNVSPNNATITITVIKKTPNLPTFSTGVFECDVSEDSASGTTVTTITASTQTSCSIVYSISDTTHFTIDSSTGVLSTSTGVLDYETSSFYSLDVTAACGSLTGVAKIAVTISDTNDNSPQCQSTDQLFVSEDLSVGSVLYSWVCTDLDTGVNGALSYSVVEGTDFFEMGSPEETVVLKSSVDRETSSSHFLKVEVCDGGSPALCTQYSLTVYVTDVNDNTPQFTGALTFTVSEDAKENYMIGKVIADDGDEGANSQVTYSLLTPNANITLFGSGELIVQNSLDYEVIPRYFLQVIASDHGTIPRSNTTLITIIVLDVNDNSPVFDKTNLTFSVLENAPPPVSLGTVDATDADADNTITYSLTNSRVDYFTVNSTTGEFSTTTLLDYEHVAKHEIVLKATDSGTPPRSTTVKVIVNVNDVNDNTPVFEQDVYFKSVREDVSVGSEVALVKAIDADTDLYNKVTYSLTSEYFVISQSGVITTKAGLDRESTSSHNLTITAADNGGLSSECNVVITVQDVNDNAPQFETNTLIMDIVESTAVGTVITTIIATDADSGSNAQITYTMKTSEYFAIDKNTGHLVLLKKLQYQLHTTVTLSITATDHGSPRLSSLQTLSVTVIDVNDNKPYFTDDITNVEVTENSREGTIVFTVKAVDVDSGSAGQVKYNITPPFTVGADSGVVSVTGGIDREVTDTLSSTVCAVDQAYPIAERLETCKVVVVSVADENDNSPVFTNNDDVRVKEDVSVGSVISVINATDYDLNKTLQYTIISQSPAKTVTIDKDSGVLILARALDYETESVACVIKVEVEDEGQLKSSIDLQILVVDVNDNAPIFTTPSTNIPKYLPPTIAVNDIIFTVTASDADSGGFGTVTFSLISSQGNFKINPSTGEIRVAASMSDKKFETFTVKATDGGGLSVKMQLSFQIQSKNTVPQCSKKESYSYSEATPINTLLFSTTCWDQDWGTQGELDFTIVNGNSANHFQILPSGDVILVSAIDYEVQKQFDIVILAQDRGKPSLKDVSKITLNVVNENDNSPYFLQSEGVVRVSEDAAVNTVISSTGCSDPDLDTLSYRLSDSSVFSVTDSGDVVLASGLDRESTDQYKVTVTCSDSKFSAEFLLYIIVTDVDDSVPVFYSSPQFKVVSGQSIVGAVGATDADDSTLSYSIVSSKRSTQYSIDPDYGIIRCVTGSCSSENLKIKASGRSQTSQKSVQVNFGVPSGTADVFERSFYSINVSEARSVGSIILKIKTISTEGIVIEGGNYGTTFGISNKSELYVNTKLDYETWEVYNLTLSVLHQGFNYYTIVQVNVINVNDNVPVFLPSHHAVYLTDSIAPGETILNVTASGAEGDVLYDMEYTSLSHLYSIDKVQGVITTKDSLINQGTEHHLIIKAYSPQASNPLYITTHISKSEHPGVFTKESYNFDTYISSELYTVIGKVEVNSLNYRYTFQPASSILHLYPDSGVILLKDQLTGDVLQETIIATNTLNTSLTTSTSLTINILPSICDPNPCLNSGQCVDYTDQYVCYCPTHTLGTNCECLDQGCNNEGTCQFMNNTNIPIVECLCSDGSYRETCSEDNTLIMVIIIAGVATLVIMMIVVMIVCLIKSRRRKGKFDKAVMRDRDEVYANNIQLNPINVTHLDSSPKPYDNGIIVNPNVLALDKVPQYNNYSEFDDPYHFNTQQRDLSNSGSHHYENFRRDHSYRSSSSECTEAVIFSKLKQLEYGSEVSYGKRSEEGRYDKDSGLAGSLNTLCHFNDDELENYNKNYLTDWGPKVQNLVNVLDIVKDEGGPVEEEFV